MDVSKGAQVPQSGGTEVTSLCKTCVFHLKHVPRFPDTAQLEDEPNQHVSRTRHQSLHETRTWYDQSNWEDGHHGDGLLLQKLVRNRITDTRNSENDASYDPV